MKENCGDVTKTESIRKTTEMLKVTYEVKYLESKNIANICWLLKTREKILIQMGIVYGMKREKIALNFDSVPTNVNLDLLIEIMEEMENSEKIQKLEKIKNSQGKGVQAVM